MAIIGDLDAFCAITGSLHLKIGVFFGDTPIGATIDDALPGAHINLGNRWMDTLSKLEITWHEQEFVIRTSIGLLVIHQHNSTQTQTELSQLSGEWKRVIIHDLALEFIDQHISHAI